MYAWKAIIYSLRYSITLSYTANLIAYLMESIKNILHRIECFIATEIRKLTGVICGRETEKRDRETSIGPWTDNVSISIKRSLDGNIPGNLPSARSKNELISIISINVSYCFVCGPWPRSALPSFRLPLTLKPSHCFKGFKSATQRLGFNDDDDNPWHSLVDGHRVDFNDLRGRQIPNILICDAIWSPNRDADGI